MTKESLYLSCSRAYTFWKNRRSFIQNYVFDEAPVEKQAWVSGHMVQDLIYAIVKGAKIKECKDKREHNKLRESGVFGVYGSYLGAYYEIKATLPLLMDIEKNRKDILIEKQIICHEMKALGYVDMLFPKAIVDIKTTGGDIENWERTNDLIRLGLQNFLYKSIMNSNLKDLKKEHHLSFYFLVVELAYPYRVEIRTLPDSWVESCGKLFYQIQTDYIQWMAKAGDIVCKVTGGSTDPEKDNFWFKNPKNVEFKTEIYSAFIKENMLSFIKESSIPDYQVREIAHL